MTQPETNPPPATYAKRLVEIKGAQGRLSVYETDSPPPADGIERQLIGRTRLVGFTLPSISGQWEAHYKDAHGTQHHRPAADSIDAAVLLRRALKEIDRV